MRVPHQRQTQVRCEARHFERNTKTHFLVVEAAPAAKHARRSAEHAIAQIRLADWSG
jgi:hypothetical protein